MTHGVLLVAHGTVDDLADLPEFLTNIARGRPPSAELLDEVRRRYQIIGGGSPLNRINRALASALERELGVPVRLANRLFHPYPREVLAELAAAGIREVDVVPLAQHSAQVYGEAVRAAAAEHFPGSFDVVAAPNWGGEPALTEAFAQSIVSALDVLANDGGARRSGPVGLVLSAHSLPRSVIDAGDPYEAEFRASAAAVWARVQALRPDAVATHRVAFQSQGMSSGPGGRPVAWLGPNLESSVDALAREGVTRIVFAPIGFLADHVEIFFDIDVEARALAEGRGMQFVRAPSLNADAPIVAVLADVARRVHSARRSP